MSCPSVSVVIPTLNAAREIETLVRALEGQALCPVDILCVDSESDDGTVEAAKSAGATRVISIRRSEFNHGSTRHKALLETSGEFVCFLTQDAMPADRRYLENLVAPLLRDPRVALSSGRQLPRPGTRRFVQLVQGFNYPEEPNVRGIEDVPAYGIKAFFASDACSCYRRSAYLACGGFPSVETNEDMLMAARLIAAGWRVAYTPEAAVVHSHDLSPAEQFHRNRAVGRFLESHRDDLMGASEVGEGGRLVKSVAGQLVKEGGVGELLRFAADCAARLAGNRAGRRDIRREMN